MAVSRRPWRIERNGSTPAAADGRKRARVRHCAGHAGLREIRRVMKPAARVAVGLTPYSGQPNKGLTEMLMAAGFTDAKVVERDKWFCVLASKP